MKRKVKVATVEKLSEVFIHLGEASIIGGGATFFVQGLVRWGISIVGISGGILLVLVGLHIHNNADKYGA
ncbi:MAG: hypothetical protein ACRENG_38070 [bacterium]